MVLVELRVLVEKGDARVPVQEHARRLAFRAFNPGGYAQQGGLTGAVLGHQGHFLAFIDLQGDLVKQDLFPVHFGDVLQ